MNKTQHKKDDIVGTISEDKPKVAKHDEDDVQAGESGSPTAGMKIVGSPKEGKDETRLFQTAIDKKEYFTRDEAKAKGFYWKDTPEQAKAAKKH